MVVVDLPLVLAGVVIAFGLGYVTRRPTVTIVRDDSGDPLLESTKPTGSHVVQYRSALGASTLYDGASESAAADAWETIAHRHPAPDGHMTWRKPDGSLRGQWDKHGGSR